MQTTSTDCPTLLLDPVTANVVTTCSTSAGFDLASQGFVPTGGGGDAGGIPAGGRGGGGGRGGRTSSRSRSPPPPPSVPPPPTTGDSGGDASDDDSPASTIILVSHTHVTKPHRKRGPALKTVVGLRRWRAWLRSSAWAAWSCSASRGRRLASTLVATRCTISKASARAQACRAERGVSSVEYIGAFY